MKDVGEVVEYINPPSIEREDRQRYIAVSMSLYGAVLGEAVPELNKIIDATDMPQGMYLF